VSAFDGALATLLADPNLAVDAEWQASGSATWTNLRILPAAPGDSIPGLASTGGRAIAVQATLRGADLPQQPRRGDQLRWGGTTYRVETAEPDALGLSWRLGLART